MMFKLAYRLDLFKTYQAYFSVILAQNVLVYMLRVLNFVLCGTELTNSAMIQILLLLMLAGIQT